MRIKQLLNYCNAKDLAISAHESIGQKRKYTEEPYWMHCKRVCDIVARACDGTCNLQPDLMSAAWLHDVLEDVTPMNPEFNVEIISEKCGSVVACLVEELTDISKPSDGNRETRKKIDRDHTAIISTGAKIVKLADLIDNAMDIKKNDKNFYVCFRREVLQLMPHLHGLDVLGVNSDYLYNKLQDITK